MRINIRLTTTLGIDRNRTEPSSSFGWSIRSGLGTGRSFRTAYILTWASTTWGRIVESEEKEQGLRIKYYKAKCFGRYEYIPSNIYIYIYILTWILGIHIIDANLESYLISSNADYCFCRKNYLNASWFWLGHSAEEEGPKKQNRDNEIKNIKKQRLSKRNDEAYL